MRAISAARFGAAAASVGLVGLSTVAAFAQSAPSASETAEPRRVHVGGFVDAMFAYGFNQPADHVNFLPGLGTSAKRDNEATINLAQLDLTLQPAPVGVKLALGFGTATEVVHAAEVGGTATSPDVWRNVLQASVQYQTQLGRGLLLEAGLYPSHIGLEAFATRDNWNYTRSWLCELSPFYQAGLKAAYPLSDRWSAQLHLVNGWQVIGDNNRGKSVGAQLAYAHGAVSVSVNGIAGPELAGNDDDLRVLGDVVAVYNAASGLGLGVCADVAREERTTGDAARWGGAGVYLRFAPPDARSAVAARVEYYEDKHGAISGASQILKEMTVTLEHRPADALILRLEGRYDRSTAAVFSGDSFDVDDNIVRERDQFLLVLGAVTSF